MYGVYTFLITLDRHILSANMSLGWFVSTSYRIMKDKDREIALCCDRGETLHPL